MCCEDLVCARCAGPVAEGRCPTCRAARASMHHNSFSITPQMIAIVEMALLLVALIARHI
jgi:hypothetical protein